MLCGSCDDGVALAKLSRPRVIPFLSFIVCILEKRSKSTAHI